MKAIILAAALAAAAAGPALARSGETMQHLRQDHSFRQAHASFTTPDPNGVYLNGREIGADPDPNIRSSLRDEYYELQGD